jgi:hypothetical protein
MFHPHQITKVATYDNSLTHPLNPSLRVLMAVMPLAFYAIKTLKFFPPPNDEVGFGVREIFVPYSYQDYLLRLPRWQIRLNMCYIIYLLGKLCPDIYIREPFANKRPSAPCSRYIARIIMIQREIYVLNVKPGWTTPSTDWRNAPMARKNPHVRIVLFIATHPQCARRYA